MTFGIFIFAVVVASQQSAFAQPGQLEYESAITSAIERAEISVVAIARGRRASPGAAADNGEFVPHEYGTGVIIESRGLILTNYHLLGDVDKSEYAIWHNRQRYYPAKVKAADPWTDLAVLEIDAANLPAIDFGDGEQLRKGQVVISLGNPFSIVRDGNVSASSGLVSNMNGKLDSGINHNPDTVYRHGGLIQTDARLRLGSSGGPLIDLQGKMVGLVTSTKALAGYDAQAGYALAITQKLKQVIDRLKQGRESEFGFLGVEPESAKPEATTDATGIRVKQVLAGTPAHFDGVLTGDLLTHVDGHELRDVDDLLLQVGMAPADSTMQLRLVRTDPILRRNHKLQRDVTLSKRFVGQSRPVIKTVPTPRWRGITVDYYTAAASRIELLENMPNRCVRVTSVEDGSPCALAGIRKGDLITRVNDDRISTPAEFQSRVTATEGAVNLGIVGLEEPIVVQAVVE